jgi:hypothetical protein
VQRDGLAVIAGQKCLNSHRFDSRSFAHQVCSRCGIYTYHRRRFNPKQYACAIGCLDGVGPFLMREVPVKDHGG